MLALVGVALVGRLRRTGPAHIAVRASRQVMGTLASLEAVGRAGQEASLRRALERAFAAVRQVDARMSTYRPESLLSRVNRLAGDEAIELDDWTWQVMRTAGKVFRLSAGAFDPTCGPLIELWKRCGKENRLPADQDLAAAKARCGWEKLQFEQIAGGKVRLRFAVPRMRIDLGGVAKGYAIDLALQEIRAGGAVGGLVDIGGDLRSFGRPDDADRWIVALRNPFRQAILLELAVNDAAVCTSGNYHRFVTIQGRRYSHIIDPRSGRPAEAAASVTVIGPDAATTDALATALSVLGPREGMALIERLDGYEALFVVGEPASYDLLRSSGFEKFVRR